MGKGTKSLHYDWMVKYTPQEVWIAGKGLYLWLAFFFTEIFAGICFVSLFIDFGTGLVVGWLGSLLLGGVFHMLYLGVASRGWRILFRVSSSELSRGLWIIILFGAVGLIQVLPLVFSGLPWAWNVSALKVIMGVISILVIIHGFMTMSVMKALPMWNSSMMIPLSMASGLWVGSQVVVVILEIMGTPGVTAEIWARWSLFLFMGALLIYIWGNVHGSDTAKASIMRVLSGDCSALFYIGVLLIGIFIPLIITSYLWGRGAADLNPGICILRMICVLIGDAVMRYVIMKAPLYSPLI